MTNALCKTNNEALVSQCNQKEDLSTLDALIISYGKTVEFCIKAKPFSTIVQTIRSGDGIQSAIKTIRACTDVDKRRELKKSLLPWFNMGRFKNNKRKDENLVSTRHFVLDFDHLNEKKDELKEQFEQDPYVFSDFVSPGGDGIKVIYELDREITDPDEYTRVYQYYAEKFSKQYGIEADHTIDASRACFLSYDPKVFVNIDHKLLSTDVQIEEVKTPQRPGKKQKLLKSFSGTTDGHRTHSLT